MNLKTVTITGADDSIVPNDLIALSVEFPFVEWGILVSMRHVGEDRFPSFGWIRDLQSVARSMPMMNLSLHVCGQWVRDLVRGNGMILSVLNEQFNRIQLNFHAEKMPISEEFSNLLSESFGKRQIIFQLDGEKGADYLEHVRCESETVDAVPLFDASGGAGRLPDSGWPKPEYIEHSIYGTERYIDHGYAGGLGPDNLAEQIPLIGAAAGDTTIWIDMETKVRSDDNRAFDLARVRRCLEIAKPFVTPK